MDSLDYCDCCGARMNLIPRDREIGVCRKCDEHYKKTDPGSIGASGGRKRI